MLLGVPPFRLADVMEHLSRSVKVLLSPSTILISPSRHFYAGGVAFFPLSFPPGHGDGDDALFL